MRMFFSFCESFTFWNVNFEIYKLVLTRIKVRRCELLRTYLLWEFYHLLFWPRDIIPFILDTNSSELRLTYLWFKYESLRIEGNLHFLLGTNRFRNWTLLTFILWLRIAQNWGLLPFTFSYKTSRNAGYLLLILATNRLEMRLLPYNFGYELLKIERAFFCF